MKFKKGDTVWMVQLDDHTCYGVFRATFQEYREGGSGTFCYVKYTRKDREGKSYRMVVDRPADRVFETEKQACLSAAAANAKTADKHKVAEFILLERASKLK